MKAGRIPLLERLALCWRILIAARPSNAIAHAQRELEAYGRGDDYAGLLRQSALELVLAFSTQGHSGMSAALTRSNLQKLLAFEPLGPLTGADDEWSEVSNGLQQNRRCSRVFKQDGEAYDIEGRVFREPNGATFTSRDSRVPVAFPYHPTTVIVDVQP